MGVEEFFMCLESVDGRGVQQTDHFPKGKVVKYLFKTI